MSLKQEIETWVQALEHYDRHEFDLALRTFEPIAETSRILFNCGVIYATLGQHRRAVFFYRRAVSLDRFLAIAYFQAGVSHFLLGEFEEALSNFNDTLLYLRGNMAIDYEQLGLRFKLFSCEVLFNRGLCYIYLLQTAVGMQDLAYAAREKVKPDHDVIDDAIREKATGYTVFSIPVGVVYRPSEAKVKNLKAKEYLGKARLIATSDRRNGAPGMFNGSSGSTDGTGSAVDHRPSTLSAALGIDDRPRESISWAASHLVKHLPRPTGGRQHSEPPMSRSLLPPTPPPDDKEKERDLARAKATFEGRGPGAGLGPVPELQPRRRPSSSMRASRPPALDLGKSFTSEIDARQQEAKGANGAGAGVGAAPMGTPMPPLTIDTTHPRLGPKRTTSEPRGPVSRTGFSPMREAGRMFRRAEPTFAPVIEDGAEGEEDYVSPRSQTRSAASSTFFGSGHAHGQEHGYGYGYGQSQNHSQGQMRRNSQASGDWKPGWDEDELELLSGAAQRTSYASHHSNRSSLRQVPGPVVQPPMEMTKVRVKVRRGDEARLVVVEANVTMDEFRRKVRDKLHLEESELRLQMRDEDDMVTMTDQEDLEVLIATTREALRRDGGGEMGRAEVWVR